MKHVYRILENCTSQISELSDAYHRLISENRDYPNPHLHNGKWDFIPLKAIYKKDGKLETAIHQDEYIRTLLDDKLIITASFSILRPGAIIHRHRGFPGFAEKTWRAHVCFIEAEDCAFFVGEQEFKWEKGKAFHFDDSKHHSGYNRGTTDRVVLLIDIARDPEDIPYMADDNVKELKEIL